MTVDGNNPQAAAIGCAENVAVLSLLYRETSNSPFINGVACRKSHGIGYTLPLDKERDLASTLAFLARVNDEFKTIPAVCVEEVPGDGGLNVLLAVNKANADCGKQVLANLERGFAKIFGFLSQANGGCLSIKFSCIHH